MENFKSNLLKVLIVISLVVGISCRFYNLNGKALSNDETFSSTYIYGHSLSHLIDRDIVPIQELKKYQQLNPQENTFQSIKRLIEHPYVFPPLYGILMQFWARFWSIFTEDFVLISRSLSTFISLFSLLGIYLLCQELSNSSIMAWIGAAFIAVSPFHLQYSQIIRTYSLTTAATLFASAFLLRAIRINNKSSWIIYSLSVAWGLYSNLLFSFVAISHFFYVLLSEKFKITKTFRSYFLAAAVGGSLFLPWFILFISSPGLLGYSVAQVAKTKPSLLSLLNTWLRNLRPIFIDLNNPWVEFTHKFAIPQKILTVLFLILFIAAIYFLIRHASIKVRNFILCLIGFGGVLLMLKDTIGGGTYSTRLRYLIPYVIGIELVIIYFLSARLISKNFWQSKLSEITIIGLLITGIMSCIVIANSQSWWAFGAPDYPAIARQINKNPNSVVIFEDIGDALTMSYLLDDHLYIHITRKVDFFIREERGEIYQKFNNTFLFKPDNKTKTAIAKDPSLKAELISISDTFLLHQPQVWRIKI